MSSRTRVPARQPGLLADLVRRVADDAPMETTMAAALAGLRADLAADAVLFLDVPAPGRLRLAVADGWPDTPDGTTFPIAPDSQAAYVIAHPGPVVTDLETERRFTPSRLLLAHGAVTTAACRLGTREEPLGLISVIFRDRRTVTASQTQALESVCALLALEADRRRARADLLVRTGQDALTALASRSTFLGALEGVLRSGRPAALLLVDLDGFSAVNDAHGHAVGDDVLRCAARRMERAVRAGDLVARYGGDRFAVIAEDCDASGARLLGERIAGALEETIDVGHLNLSLSASIGVVADTGRRDSGALLRAADEAIAQAKAAGRGRIHVTAPGTRPAPRTDAPRQTPAVPLPGSVTLAAVEAAIARTRVVFQPIVAAADRRVIGVEALARGPEGTLFESPLAFFSAAETFYRLRELDLAAKRAAFAAGVPDGAALFVNVDPSVLTDDGFRGRLLDGWRESGFRGEVVIELTERSLVAAPGKLMRAIDACRGVGWRIALDDLGSRAETLTALRLVRPDVAKLDLRLVDRRNRSHTAAVSVAVATHRERWPLSVVAEGVETPEHEKVARDIGADLFQGFLYGRPGPLDAALGGPLAEPWRFDDAVTRDANALATKQHLLDVTRVVEAMAGGPESIVLSAIQSVAHYSARTRQQYAALARRCGMVGIIGAGLRPGVVQGVHHATIPPDDDLLSSWHVVVLAANGGVALLAEDIHAEGTDDMRRMFRYRVTRDQAAVEAAAHRLLAYF